MSVFIWLTFDWEGVCSQVNFPHFRLEKGPPEQAKRKYITRLTFPVSVVKKNSNFVDPKPYINGKLNTTGQDENKLVSSTEINNIKSVIK